MAALITRLELSSSEQRKVDKKTVEFYLVNVKSQTATWEVAKRYSELASFFERMSKDGLCGPMVTAAKLDIPGKWSNVEDRIKLFSTALATFLQKY